jgi:ribonuclease BN (tRNA processing enzyme)
VPEFSLAVDLGTGTFARLQQVMSPRDLGGLVISHAHPDHFVDLFALFYWRFFHPEPLPPLPLYTPPGLLEAIICYAPTDRAREIRSAFELREVVPAESFHIGPLTVRTHEMHHHPATIGLRISTGKATLAYTADTGPTDEIVELAREADVFLCDSTWLAAEVRAGNHLSAHQAGEYARAAGVSELLLTHLWPLVDPERAAADAVSRFGRDVRVARSGLRLSISAND